MTFCATGSKVLLHGNVSLINAVRETCHPLFEFAPLFHIFELSKGNSFKKCSVNLGHIWSLCHD